MERVVAKFICQYCCLGVSHHFGQYEDNTYSVFRIAYCVLRKASGVRRNILRYSQRWYLDSISIALAAGVYRRASWPKKPPPLPLLAKDQRVEGQLLGVQSLLCWW